MTWGSSDDPGMTWSCMICREVRPDSMIDVAHRPVEGMEALFPDGARANVRYCNDKPECIAEANEPGPWKGPKKIPETR